MDVYLIYDVPLAAAIMMARSQQTQEQGDRVQQTLQPGSLSVQTILSGNRS